MPKGLCVKILLGLEGLAIATQTMLHCFIISIKNNKRPISTINGSYQTIKDK